MSRSLERLIAEAEALAGGDRLCATLGHVWVSTGGANAGCNRDCDCSVPVNECAICGDCDYGDNEDANEVRRECIQRRELRGI